MPKKQHPNIDRPEVEMYALPKKQRYPRLLYYLRCGMPIPFAEMVKERAAYEKVRNKLLSLRKLPCYLCSARSMHRHHVVPLSRGGANVTANLVGVCIPCHQKLDLKLPKKRTRIKPEVKHTVPVKQKKAATAQRTHLSKVGSLSRCIAIEYIPPPRTAIDIQPEPVVTWLSVMGQICS